MQSTKSSSFPIGLLYLLTALLASACGGEAYSESFPGADIPIDSTEDPGPPIHGVLPYGVVPEGEYVGREMVDKWLGLGVNGSKVHIPDWYGGYAEQSSKRRCNPDAMGWDSNCYVPQNRTERVCFDSAACNAISPNLTGALSEGAVIWEDFMRNVTGWDVDLVLCDHPERNVRIWCEPPTDGAVGETTGLPSFCWDVPGHPHDVCFYTHSRGIMIDLQYIENVYGNGTSGKNVARNVIRHELGHLSGLGHRTESNQLMSSTIQANFSTTHTVPHLTVEKDGIRNFNRDLEPCKWQWPDPIGLACPHEGPY